MDSFFRWLICVFRPASESLTDRFALMDYEARRLLSAIVKNVVQMTAEELEQTSDDSRYELLSGLSERVYLKRPTCTFIPREVVTVDPVSEVRNPWRLRCRESRLLVLTPACQSFWNDCMLTPEFPT